MKRHSWLETKPTSKRHVLPCILTKSYLCHLMTQAPIKPINGHKCSYTLRPVSQSRRDHGVGGSWLRCSCKWFNVWHTRKSTVPIGPSASYAYTEGQKQWHHKPTTPPRYSMGASISWRGTFWRGKWPTREKRPTGVKKPTGPTCLSLTSTNVYTWECLVP